MNKPVRNNPLLAASARAGLSKTEKRLEAKWFYDPAGSALFEEITELPEYYPTRTEIGILRGNMQAIDALFPDETALVELGSGASTKTRLLLSGVPKIDTYVPLDISGDFLMATATALAADFPAIAVQPVVADFMEPLNFPTDIHDRSKVAFFPGSTLGNLDADAAVDLLSRVRGWPNVRGFLLGVDLVKSVSRLIAAYDDAAGVTAAFNLNILHRLNREAGGTIDTSAFRHEARWNGRESRIEMHLVAKRALDFLVDGQKFLMRVGESIHTENSHKYTFERIGKMAERSGWKVQQIFTDERDDFGVVFLEPAG